MRYVLWELNVKSHGFAEHIAAAVSGRFDGIALSYRAFLAEQAAGRTAREVTTAALDQGVSVDFLDGLTSWTPKRFSAAGAPFMRQAFDFSLDEAFAFCDVTGARNMVAVAGFAEGAMPFEQQVEHFASFCQRASERGISVALEAMPILGAGIPTLRQAWDIVRVAAQPNASVMFDSWHFMRRGADMDLLHKLPRGAIQHIQLVDGLLTPGTGDLNDDAFHHREVPGRGYLPLLYLLRVLHATQDIASVGPEAILDRLDTLTGAHVGSEVGQATEQAVVAAGFASRTHL